MASPVVLRAQAASLRRDYPGWHFIVSSTGRIWAQCRMPDFDMKLPEHRCWRCWLPRGRVHRRRVNAALARAGRFEVYDCVEGDTAREVREKIAAKEGR